MSERWWRRRRRFDPWFGDVFEEADKMERMTDNLMRQAFGSPAEREKARRRYMHQSGDFLHPTPSDSSQVGDECEPLIDLFMDETSVVVVAALQGINKESIEVDATEDKVTISVNSSGHKYYRELNLPAKVDPKSSAASFKNGVLEVRLKKIVERRLLIR